MKPHGYKLIQNLSLLQVPYRHGNWQKFESHFDLIEDNVKRPHLHICKYLTIPLFKEAGSGSAQSMRVNVSFPDQVLGQAEVDLQLPGGQALVRLPPAQAGVPIGLTTRTNLYLRYILTDPETVS